ANAAPNCTFAAEIFAREAGIHNPHRLFLVVVFNSEVATFQHLEAERREVTIGDGFEIALWAVSLRHIILAINLIFAEATKGQSETVTHRRALEAGIGVKRAQSALEKFHSRLWRWIIPFHQAHAGAVNAVFVIAVIQSDLI